MRAVNDEFGFSSGWNRTTQSPRERERLLISVVLSVLYQEVIKDN